MGAWNQDQGSEDITMLADGNGEFAEALGLTMDASKFGMGKRSQRYSMIVNDGVVEQLNVEAPGEYSASSAETYARPALSSSLHPRLAFRQQRAQFLGALSAGGRVKESDRCRISKRDSRGRFRTAAFSTRARDNPGTSAALAAGVPA